jgi:double-stranded uracil-DNA glycosylase
VADQLPDVLSPGLRVVFCGTAAGTTSARVGAYYAGRGNKFWATLGKVGLTPRQLRPHEFRQLLDYGIGLTDLAKEVSGPDSSLAANSFDRAALRAKMGVIRPRVIAFNGKKAAHAALATRVEYGWVRETIAEVPAFVLPSTSGLASQYWDETWWRDLADWIRSQR